MSGPQTVPSPPFQIPQFRKFHVVYRKTLYPSGWELGTSVVVAHSLNVKDHYPCAVFLDYVPLEDGMAALQIRKVIHGFEEITDLGEIPGSEIPQ